jgi:WD40 repeat protein
MWLLYCRCYFIVIGWWLTPTVITSDNTKIVSGSEDRTIKVWDLHMGKCYLSYRFDTEISAIAFSKSKNLIAFRDKLEICMQAQ